MSDPTTPDPSGKSEFEDCPGDWAAIAPKLPYPWRLIKDQENWAAYSDARRWESAGCLRVICSVLRYNDGRRWLHVSASRPDRKGKPRMPSYADLKAVKSLFIGDGRKALQKASEHVSEFDVLHLWCCLDADPLPDFRIAGTI